jgi:surface antigen
VLVAILAVSVVACAQNRGQKETGGAIVGAVAGGLLGAQFGKGSGKLAAVAAGTLLGAWVGSEVGKSLDRADRLAMQQTTHSALETSQTNQTSSWRNPDSGHSGTVTPVKTYQTTQGQYCRESPPTVNVGGKTQQAYGTACRQPDGSWKVVN